MSLLKLLNLMTWASQIMSHHLITTQRKEWKKMMKWSKKIHKNSMRHEISIKIKLRILVKCSSIREIRRRLRRNAWRIWLLDQVLLTLDLSTSSSPISSHIVHSTKKSLWQIWEIKTTKIVVIMLLTLVNQCIIQIRRTPKNPNQKESMKSIEKPNTGGNN